jgi:hypothetical protein
MCISFDQKTLGYNLGEFLTNSSGHPAGSLDFQNEGTLEWEKNPECRIKWSQLLRNRDKNGKTFSEWQHRKITFVFMLHTYSGTCFNQSLRTRA